MTDRIAFYVSTCGNDDWSGRLPEPAAGGGDGPFATPGRALAAARESAAQGPASVQLRGGCYELAETLVFTPADDGQVWSAFPGERAVLSGGRTLTGWQVGSHAGRPCWTLDLPEVAAGHWAFTQLWVNGRRRLRPRLPKTGFYRFSGLVEGDAGKFGGWGKGPARVCYRDGEIRRFHNLDDVELVAYQQWFDTHHRIKALDEERRVVEFHAPSIGSLVDETGDFARYVLVNVFEALTEPGEWYLDRTAGRLYYLPLPGETPDTVSVVAPRLAEIVRFEGTADRPVSGVRLEHLALCHNQWSRARNHPGVVQAAYDVPGAVVFDRAEGCVLYGCEIAHCAGYGVETLAGCHGTVIAACSIHDLGGGGVKIGHEELRRGVGSDVAPPPKWLKPQAATVADCHLHNGGLVYPSAIGVWIGNAGFNRIQHNHIHHFAYTGISLGWTWSFEPTRTVDNRIEYNHIHHINHERLLADNGGIYALGVQPGSRVVGNHLHDIACHGYGGWGLYPDEGASNILYADNLVHRVQDCGFSIHYGRFLTVRNNIFADMDRAMLNPGRRDLCCGLVFERNLVWFDRGSLKADADWAPSMVATRRNLLWNAAGPIHWPAGSLAAEEAAGRWRESLVADPLFRDPLGGDFTLREDSPALALGFKPFDWRRAGPRLHRKLPARYADYLLPTAAPVAVAVARIESLDQSEDDRQTRLRARVTVTNPSSLPVTGRLRLRLSQRVRGATITPAALAVSLAPGEAMDTEVVVTIPGNAPSPLFLMACGDEKHLFGGALELNTAVTIRLPRLAAVSGLDELAARLADGLPVELTHATHPIFRGHAAVVGEALALSAEVSDPSVNRARQPWEGSSVELFLRAHPGPGESPAMRQLFVTPPDGDTAPVLADLDGACPAGALCRSERSERGWRFSLLIPLAAAGIAADAAVFRFDFICNATSPIAGQNLIRLPKWGSIANHSNGNALARVRVFDSSGRGSQGWQ
jgi:hypothetical protein